VDIDCILKKSCNLYRTGTEFAFFLSLRLKVFEGLWEY
jgi:hypothetical protein